MLHVHRHRPSIRSVLPRSVWLDGDVDVCSCVRSTHTLTTGQGLATCKQRIVVLFLEVALPTKQQRKHNHIRSTITLHDSWTMIHGP